MILFAFSLFYDYFEVVDRQTDRLIQTKEQITKYNKLRHRCGNVIQICVFREKLRVSYSKEMKEKMDRCTCLAKMKK